MKYRHAKTGREVVAAIGSDLSRLVEADPSWIKSDDAKEVGADVSPRRQSRRRSTPRTAPNAD